ncbi:MAG: HAMP domain-containing protein [Planctomycetes bacterium]|nr:HAMP domain-containing protein [Planctomycetota bacterium]
MYVRSELAALSIEQAESSGVQPAWELIKLVRNSQEHRGLSAGLLTGDESRASARAAEQVEVQASIATVADALSGIATPELLEQRTQIAKTFASLAADVEARALTGPESFQRHTAMIEQELALLQDVLDASGLARDSSIDTHYLVAGAFDSLPAVTEVLGQARARGAGFLTRRQISTEDRVKLGLTSELVRGRFRDAQSAFTKSLAAEPAFVTRIQDSSRAASAAFEAAVATIDTNLVAPAELTFPPAEYFAAMTTAIDAQYAVIETASELLGAKLDERLARTERSLAIGIGSLVIAISIATTLIFVIARSTARSVASALTAVESLSKGDLTARVQAESRDEIGQILAAVGVAVENIATVVRDIGNSGRSVSAASAELSAGAGELSDGAQSSAASLEQTSASMQQLNTTAQQTTENAGRAERIASEARTVATTGGEVAREAIAAMQGIDEASKSIARIIDTIDEIAFQTNLLALNAAVEAARAGEEGRGFAVVAGEVRQLSIRSADAAKEIKALVNTSLGTVERGTALVGKCGSQLTDIVGAVERLGEVVSEISRAARSQSGGIEQVSIAIGQLDTVTQANAARTEELSATAAQLSDQSAVMLDTVSRFRVPA